MVSIVNNYRLECPNIIIEFFWKKNPNGNWQLNFRRGCDSDVEFFGVIIVLGDSDFALVWGNGGRDTKRHAGTIIEAKTELERQCAKMALIEIASVVQDYGLSPCHKAREK